MRKQTKLAVVLAAAALVAVASASLVSAAGWVQDGADWRYQDSAGDYVAEVMKKSGDTTFYLDADGIMAKDYFCEYNDNYYYFGSNGAMVRNTWVAIDPALVDSGDEDVDAYWYYFQDTGKAFKGGDSDVKKKKIDGKTYFFNSDGQMLTGWFDGSGEKYNVEDENDFVDTGADDVVYYAGEDGVARAGWLAWTDGLVDSRDIGNNDASDRQTLYFYFNTSNFKRVQGKEKTINGKKYRFDDGGIMYTGWEWDEDEALSTPSDYKYYSGEDDGHLVKKGWVYAVPSEDLDSEKNYDDEEAYFYFNNSGLMVAGEQRRINGKYYVFNKKGLMKTGLVFLDSANKYVDKVDLEYTNGEDLIKNDLFYTGERNDATNKKPLGGLVTNGTQSIHYFGSDGAKVTGNKITVEFADDTYTFASKNSGGFTTEKKKKFYSNGFLLTATEDLKLGLVAASDSDARIVWPNIPSVNGGANKTIEFAQDVDTDTAQACYVVSTTGAKKKKGAYKDGDGNYWLVNTNSCLVGIYDVQVKYATNAAGAVCCQWKGNIGADAWYTLNGVPSAHAGSDGKDDTYIDFNCPDKSGKTQKDHLVPINNDYCLNFLVTALNN